ncbi:hypothetical protein [Carboxydothermus ferrireducens]|uniref:hypothetical protein n=1 Tax=Carboxydothermus ferrireducens TaxID=54265 RepID=UPI0012B5FFA2|nr:hypothetical protein [Carboxydothermus ferrireducens]
MNRGRWKEVRELLEDRQKKKYKRKLDREFGTKKWYVRQKYHAYTYRCMRSILEYLRQAKKINKFHIRLALEMKDRNEYLRKFYCAVVENVEVSSVAEAQKLINQRLLQSPPKSAVGNIAGIIEQTFQRQRTLTYVYVPSREAITAYEILEDIKQYPANNVPDKLLNEMIENAVQAVKKAGITASEATVEDIVLGRRRVISLEELERFERKETMRTIMKILNSRNRAEILALFTPSQVQAKQYAARSGSRTGRKGKGGGVKNIEKAIACTAIARS